MQEFVKAGRHRILVSSIRRVEPTDDGGALVHLACPSVLCQSPTVKLGRKDAKKFLASLDAITRPAGG